MLPRWNSLPDRDSKGPCVCRLPPLSPTCGPCRSRAGTFGLAPDARKPQDSREGAPVPAVRQPDEAAPEMETDMAKGQMRSNKEVKKPKKVKTAAPSPAAFAKGQTEGSLGAKKKP
jgi:hypothetical protein